MNFIDLQAHYVTIISCSIITISLHISSILIRDAVGREKVAWANIAKIKSDQKQVL
jgi:hypothetical protein